MRVVVRRWGGWGESGSECVGWEGMRVVVSWGVGEKVE